MFRSRNLTGATFVRVLFPIGMFGQFFLGALYLQHVLGYSAITTGLAFMPMNLAVGIFSLTIAARIMTRVGAKATLMPGLALIAVGLALFSRVPVDGHYLSDVLPGMLSSASAPGWPSRRPSPWPWPTPLRPTPAWRRDWPTCRCRWGRPSASPCWPASRRRGPGCWSAGGSTRRRGAGRWLPRGLPHRHGLHRGRLRAGGVGALNDGNVGKAQTVDATDRRSTWARARSAF